MTNKPARTAVEFRELRSDDVVAVCRLSDTLDEAQRRMVADNAISIAQGHCSPDAWMRAIYAGGEPVGFVMLHEGDDISDGIDCEGPFLWRLMIAGPQQGKGYGRAAVEQLVAMLRARGATRFTTSCGQGEGNPEGFYRGLGFQPTGEWYDDEVELRLEL